MSLLDPTSNAFGSVASPILTGAMTLAGTALQAKYNREMAERQNQYNIDMWKMQADYNSPQAQMRRFQDAGLNPNLIYGQGNNGNMTSAPEQLAAQVPDVQGAASQIAKAFNVQNLMLNAQKIREAKANAKVAEINAMREHDHYEADQQFGYDYDFDPSTGQFYYNPKADQRDFNGSPAANYYQLMHLSDNYTKNALLVPRSTYLTRQAELLAPQIHMRNYDWNNYQKTFWLDKATIKNPIGIGAALWHYINEYRRGNRKSFNF